MRLAPQLAVDANRDGEIKLASEDASDATSDANPYCFWVNDDIDRWHVTNNALSETAYEQDDLDVSPDGRLDWQENVLPAARDLEDFSRLWITTEGLSTLLKDASGNLFLGFKWTDIPEGSPKPAIKIYKSVEADGGIKYLSDVNTASLQISSNPATGFAVLDARYEYSSDPNSYLSGTTINDTDFFVLPKSLFSDISESRPRLYLLFEGCKKGMGQLKLIVLKKEGTIYTEIGEGPGVWIDLHPIRDFYQTWTVGDSTSVGVRPEIMPSVEYSPVAGSPTLPAPIADEEKDFILLVHGWNMTVSEKNHFAETSFKRLWWQGYKGRFGLFRWPTFFTNPDDPNGYGPALDPQNFDASEWNSWRSASGLLQLLNTLKGTYKDEATGNSRVRVFAHSHGNQVTGEALRGATAPVVHTYVATQAAIAAHCYDNDTTRVPDISANWESAHWYLELLQRPELINPVLAAFTGQALAIKTPNLYAYYPGNAGLDSNTQFPTQGGPYMTGAKGAGKWVNFYNVSDWALDGWITNQAFKPDMGYNYQQLSGSTVDYNVTGWWFTRNFLLNTISAGVLSIPEDTHQIFAFAAQGRSQPLGRQPGVQGLFNGQQTAWNQYGDKHPGHSAQFRSSISERWDYWDRLLISFALKQEQ